jgi:hypothetical protein
MFFQEWEIGNRAIRATEITNYAITKFTELPNSPLSASEPSTTAATSTPAATTVASTTAASVATAASTITPTSTTAAGPAAKTAAFRLGTGLIHVDIAGAQLRSIGPGNGLLCLFVVCHFHKAKTPWLACIAVAHDRHIINLSIRLKSAPQFIFGDVVIQIADIDILHRSFFEWKQLPQLLAGLLVRARAERVAEFFLLVNA